MLWSAFIVKNLFIYFHIYCQGTFVYGARREIALNLLGYTYARAIFSTLRKIPLNS